MMIDYSDRSQQELIIALQLRDKDVESLLSENKRLKELCERAANTIEQFRDYHCNCPERALIEQLQTASE